MLLERRSHTACIGSFLYVVKYKYLLQQRIFEIKVVDVNEIYILCHVTFLLCLCLEFHHMLLGNEIKKDETGGACRTHGRDEEKPLGRPRRRWEYNIRADLRDMVGKQWNGIHLA